MKTASPARGAAEPPAFQPLYRQIKSLITQSLVSGEWRPGDPIPSELELARHYEIHVLNDNLERTANELARILLQNHCGGQSGHD